MPTKLYNSFESILVSFKNPVFQIFIIYRSPSKSSAADVREFLTEFEELLTTLYLNKKPCLIAGDFNINSRQHKKFHDDFCTLISLFDYTQHIDLPTHKDGNTLDLLITSLPISQIYSTNHSSAISDLSLIHI